jgi:hypothetical protein
MIARIVALIALAAVCGCGGGAEDDEAREPAITPTPTPMKVEIDEPLNGASVVAREEIAFRLVARVEVAGRAAPGAVLLMRTTCRDADCIEPMHAGPRGRFRAVATVWSREEHTGGTIVVGVAGSAPTTHERVVVRLLPPRERREPKKERERESEPPEAVATPTPAPPRTLVMIGDSLAQGTEPYLAGMLDGWQVTTDARRGRPLAEGMGVLDATPTPSPAVLAFSLFTNDSPTAVDSLEAAVRRSVQRAGPRGCAVWATIVRPPLSGVSYDAANRRLNALASDSELAGRLIIVPWAEVVARNPGLIAADGVHGTAAGYETRARLYASAARACTG